MLSFAAGDIEFTPLEPREALRYFRNKTVGARFSYNWQDVQREEHAAAFVVAKAMRADILQDIYDGLETALAEGQTVQEFTKNLRPFLQDKGWWGFKETADPLTGEIRRSELGTPRRLQTIYDVNLKSARAAGRWERIQRARRTRPYLVYYHAGDGRVRPQHKQWGQPNPVVLPVEHPFWKTHYPPNGWRCRCIVIQVTGRWLKQRGLKVSNETELSLTGYGKTKPFKNPRTGAVRQVPAGLDAGFDYNVGESRLQALTPGSDGGPIISGTQRAPNAVPGTSLLPLLSARPAPRGSVLTPDVKGEAAVAAFLSRFDGPLFTDPAQIPLPINRALFETPNGTLKIDKRLRNAYVPLMAETIKDPDEIWVHTGMDKNGKRVTSRLSYASWTVDGQTYPITVIFSEDGNHWRAVTAFQSDNANERTRFNYLVNSVRIGTLVYRRGEIKPDDSN